MAYLILTLLVLGALFGPQLWARAVFRHYARPRPDLAGSGGELARHLLDRFGLKDVGLERLGDAGALGEGSVGDHYDPTARCVRLAAENFDGRSLTAVAIAAHEVGHAIQHARREPLFTWRLRLAVTAQAAERIGAIAMLALPVITLITRIPQSGLLMFLIGFGSFGLAAVVHLITLPVERDASFGKALPILEQGGYLGKQDLPAVRRILSAAALTYLAASLAGLLNLGRWWRLLRR